MKRALKRVGVVVGILVALVGILLVVVVLRLVAGPLAGPAVLEEARARFEAEVGPLRPELADATVPPEENAAVLLRQAVAALEIGEEAYKFLTSVATDPGKADPRQRERIHGIVDRNATALARIDGAAQRPYSLFRPRRESFRGGYDTTEWLTILRLSRLIGAAGLVAVVEGDRAAYRDSIQRLTTLSRALRQERTVMAWIVSVVCEELLHELMHLRLTRPVSTELIATVDGALKSVENAPHLREVLAVEGSVADASYSETANEARESDDGNRICDNLSIWGPSHFRAAMILTYVEVAQRLNQPLDDWPKPQPTSWWRFLGRSANPFSTPKIVGFILRPNLLDVVEKTQRAQAEHALARAALAYLTGAPPAPEAETVVYSDEPIRRRTLENGGLEFSLPRAAELIRAHAAKFSDPTHPIRRRIEHQADRMTWRLPPPNRTAA